MDEELLCELKPDLILTQNLCQVCAPSGNDLASALKLLDPTPEILWMSPHSLAEIFENIRELGRATDRSNAAESCIDELPRAIGKNRRADQEYFTAGPRVLHGMGRSGLLRGTLGAGDG